MFKWWFNSKLPESSQQNPLNFKIPYIEMEKKKPRKYSCNESFKTKYLFEK